MADWTWRPHSIFSTRQRSLVDKSPKGVTKLEENFKADANDFIIV